MPWFDLASGVTQALRPQVRAELQDLLSRWQAPDAEVTVGISAAYPEADIDAAVWPGVSTIVCPRVEDAAEVEAVDALITGLEKHRGLRHGSVALDLRIDTPSGVQSAFEIAIS